MENLETGLSAALGVKGSPQGLWLGHGLIGLGCGPALLQGADAGLDAFSETFAGRTTQTLDGLFNPAIGPDAKADDLLHGARHQLVG